MDMNKNVQGIEKRKFTNSLSALADQLRLIDQKITMCTDNDIQQEFYSQKKKMSNLDASVKKISVEQVKYKKKITLSSFTFKGKKRTS